MYSWWLREPQPLSQLGTRRCLGMGLEDLRAMTASQTPTGPEGTVSSLLWMQGSFMYI